MKLIYVSLILLLRSMFPHRCKCACLYLSGYISRHVRRILPNQFHALKLILLDLRLVILSDWRQLLLIKVLDQAGSEAFWFFTGDIKDLKGGNLLVLV
jgi:hypothetical protein